MSFEICFTRRYCMSHRLYNIKNSRCYVPHGHNEYVKVTLVSTGSDRLDGAGNMMAPFSDLKKVWHRWIDDHVDHSLQLSHQDPMLDYFKNNEPENLPHIMVTPGDPTTEALAALFLSKINALLANQDLGMRCVKIEVEETPTNTVTFTGDPKTVLSMANYDGPETPWWQRADMSVNDLDL